MRSAPAEAGQDRPCVREHQERPKCSPGTISAPAPLPTPSPTPRRFPAHLEQPPAAKEVKGSALPCGRLLDRHCLLPCSLPEAAAFLHLPLPLPVSA